MSAVDRVRPGEGVSWNAHFIIQGSWRNGIYDLAIATHEGVSYCTIYQPHACNQRIDWDWQVADPWSWEWLKCQFFPHLCPIQEIPLHSLSRRHNKKWEEIFPIWGKFPVTQLLQKQVSPLKRCPLYSCTGGNAKTLTVLLSPFTTHINKIKLCLYLYFKHKNITDTFKIAIIVNQISTYKCTKKEHALDQFLCLSNFFFSEKVICYNMAHVQVTKHWHCKQLGPERSECRFGYLCSGNVWNICHTTFSSCNLFYSDHLTK